jgi:hypothetical protein
LISAKVILDSVAPNGKRLTTFLLEYPRIIHAEVMTHRLFSRNASSSRAIPVAKQIERIKNDPAMPIHWGKNQPGMQANEELGQTSRMMCEALWLKARDNTLELVEQMSALGLHKQVANRLLEPWMHIAVLVTATDYGNFYNLRYHKMAQPEIQVLAQKMWEAQQASEPVRREPSQWHLPFIVEGDSDKANAYWLKNKDIYPLEVLKRVSAARCARLSYYNFDGKKTSIEEDLALYDKLMGGFPKHASPTEHQATPHEDANHQSGNFFGWEQFRKTIRGEYLPEFKGPTP